MGIGELESRRLFLSIRVYRLVWVSEYRSREYSPGEYLGRYKVQGRDFLSIISFSSLFAVFTVFTYVSNILLWEMGN